MFINFIKSSNGLIMSFFDVNSDEKIGTIEIIIKKNYNYIENIYIRDRFRHKGYFRKFIEYLGKMGNIVCIPLPEHVDKFKHLGFKVCWIEGDDIYYFKGI